MCTNKCDNNLRKEGDREGRRTGKIEKGKEREGGEGGVLFSCLLILRQGLELAM